MNTLRSIILVSTLILSATAIGQAQGPPAPPGSNNPAPFGFVELLIGAGALYGGKKAWDKRKDKAS